jgi:hypothetical protein
VEDVSLCSGVGQLVCTDGDGIREARHVPNSGGGRMRLAAGCGTRGCVEGPLMSDAGAADIGDRTRRAILEVSPDAVRLEPMREDRRGVGSIDLRC